MAPKPLNHKCDHFKSGFNELEIVDYPICNPIYDNCVLDLPAIRNIQWPGNRGGPRGGGASGAFAPDSFLRPRIS